MTPAKIQIIWPSAPTDIGVDVNFDGEEYYGRNPAYTNYMSINNGKYFIQFENHPMEEAIKIGDRATLSYNNTRYPYKIADAAYWQGDELEFLSDLNKDKSIDLTDLTDLPAEDEFKEKMVPWGNKNHEIGSTELWIELIPA